MKTQRTSAAPVAKPDGQVINKQGTIAQVTRVSSDLIGSMKGRIRVKGDILSTGIDWNPDPLARGRTSPPTKVGF
jgi:hypothetical protein